MDLHLSGISVLSYYFAGFYKKENVCEECEDDHFMDIINQMTYCKRCAICDSAGK